LFAEENVEARVMTLPAGKDPDSFVCEFGGPQFLELAKGSLPMMGFLLETTIRKCGLSLEGKVKIVERLKAPLLSMSNHVGRAVYVKELAQRLDVDESAILEQIGTPRRVRGKGPMPRSGVSSPCKLEETLIGMMLQSPEVIETFDASEMLENIQNDDLKLVGKMILEGLSKNPPCTGADLIGETQHARIRNLISSLVTTQETWDPDNCLKIIKQYQMHIQRNHARSLSRRIKAAEQANDQGLLDRLLAEKQRCVQRKSEGLTY